MAYSDFDLETVQERFGLTLHEDEDLFAAVGETTPSAHLEYTLAHWGPIAQAMNTEKARSEMIIAPILMDAVRAAGGRLTLFSGITFDVDRSRELNGVCDFLLSLSPERYFIRRPVIAVVEAKREDIPAGLGQCLAEMVAARVFNERKGDAPGVIYGAVTTGTNWRFVKLDGAVAWIDGREYFSEQVGKILGILGAMAA